jgi:drug/metabolite transporter, DME family
MGPLLIVLAAVTWGTTGATMKLIDTGGASVSPLLVGFFRVAIAAPVLCVASRWLGGPIRVGDRGERIRLLVAGLAMGAFQVFYFAGVAKTSVAVGSLVAICSAPIFITALAAALLGERIDGRTWAALCAGIAGAAFLTVGPHGLGRLPPGFVGGVLLALGGGVSYATYAVMVKDVVRRVAPLTVAALTFSIAALSLLPVLFVEAPPVDARAWTLLAYLGVVPTAVAYILYVLGLRTTSVVVSGVLTLVEPLTATLLGVLFFGDRLGPIGSLGAALLLGAVLGLTLRRRRASPPPPTGSGTPP